MMSTPPEGMPEDSTSLTHEASKLFQEWRRDDLMEELTSQIGTPEEIQQEVRAYAVALDEHRADMAALKDQQATEMQEVHAMHADERKNLASNHNVPACLKMKELKKQAEMCVADYRKARREEKELDEFIRNLPIENQTLCSRASKWEKTNVSMSSIQKKVQQVVEDESKTIQERAADLHAKLTQYWVILNPKTTADVSSCATREPLGDNVVNEITALLTTDKSYFPTFASMFQQDRLTSESLLPQDAYSSWTAGSHDDRKKEFVGRNDFRGQPFSPMAATKTPSALPEAGLSMSAAWAPLNGEHSVDQEIDTLADNMVQKELDTLFGSQSDITSLAGMLNKFVSPEKRI